MHSANILVFGGSEQAAVAAGDAFIASARTSGTRPVGLATGQTMTPVYDHLLTIDGQANGLFADTVFSQLDEVIGQTSPTDSFATEITTSLFSQFRATPAGFLMIDGQAGDPASEAMRHCSAIRMAGGLAMQPLGPVQVLAIPNAFELAAEAQLGELHDCCSGAPFCGGLPEIQCFRPVC